MNLDFAGAARTPVPFALASAARGTATPPVGRPAHRPDPSAADMAGTLQRVLDQLDYGVALVDEHAHVHLANRAACREWTDARPLRMAEGRLLARQERDQQRLQRALAAVRSGRRSLLGLRHASVHCTLAVLPLQEPDTTPGDAVALLLFGRQRVCEPLSVEFFAREHGLTSAETAVLAQLAAGLRPAQVARSTGVALSTVRTHITSIRLKTGTRSIGELLQFVTVLPPIMRVWG